jgi:outer membrane protein assembly factor BamD (BamD/ComL family)
MQEVQQEFQQLGEDLQSGNLSAAQADFATLQSLSPQASSSSSASSSGQSTYLLAQAFSQLSSDLQAGNLSAAQQDYSTIQQDLQSQETQTHHHHHHGDGSESSGVSQLMTELGQDLQSGNLTAAQQTYGTLQQDFQQFTQAGPTALQSTAQTSSTSVSA